MRLHPWNLTRLVMKQRRRRKGKSLPLQVKSLSGSLGRLLFCLQTTTRTCPRGNKKNEPLEGGALFFVCPRIRKAECGVKEHEPHACNLAVAGCPAINAQEIYCPFFYSFPAVRRSGGAFFPFSDEKNSKSSRAPLSTVEIFQSFAATRVRNKILDYVTCDRNMLFWDRSGKRFRRSKKKSAFISDVFFCYAYTNI